MAGIYEKKKKLKKKKKISPQKKKNFPTGGENTLRKTLSFFEGSN